jgi:hydroxymethylbilane synthase
VAGLRRLDLGARIRSVFDASAMIPAAGQGALGIEVREHASALRMQLETLTHRPTWLAVQAERAVSRALGGSCSMPLAAHARWHRDVLTLDVALGHPEDTARPLLRAQSSAPVADDDAARALGDQAAHGLRSQGAADYLAT